MTDMQAWLDQGKTLAEARTYAPFTAKPDEYGDKIVLKSGGYSLRTGDWGDNDTIQPTANAKYVNHAIQAFPQALDALQAVLDMHKPETRYESAGEWDLDGTYIPYCAHGSEWDHPDHVMIYGWWQCTTAPEQVCPYDSDGDDEAVWPCPTVEAIQRALTTPNYLEENDTLDPPM